MSLGMTELQDEVVKVRESDVAKTQILLARC